ncbi:MAG: Asp23/Gls24 family envelope stress response protein [Oscillospiraceae bacterium]|nr:Asp23/Gls24 family envelope stress response protein [Oscillospiraceae bacterium]
MQPKTNNTTGNVRISDGVIASLVARILDEIDGVHSLAVKLASVVEKLISPEDYRPVITTIEQGAAKIDISVNLCFGCHMKDVAAAIQERVKDAVQDMTGIAVSKVNIFVAGIKAKEE